MCAMPIWTRCPDSLPHLEQQLALIRRDAAIRVLPYGSITRGQLGEEAVGHGGHGPHVAAFSDDGRACRARRRCALPWKPPRGFISSSWPTARTTPSLHGGYIHDRAYARTHGHRICSESEWGADPAGSELVRQTGCGLPLSATSPPRSGGPDPPAKAGGAGRHLRDGPHYLLMDETMLQEDGRFKMNPLSAVPPTRRPAGGLADGTIDMIATDPPPSAEEKSRGLEKKRHGHRGAGDRLSPAVYLSGKAGPALPFPV